MATFLKVGPGYINLDHVSAVTAGTRSYRGKPVDGIHVFFADPDPENASFYTGNNAGRITDALRNLAREASEAHWPSELESQ